MCFLIKEARGQRAGRRTDNASAQRAAQRRERARQKAQPAVKLTPASTSTVGTSTHANAPTTGITFKRKPAPDNSARGNTFHGRAEKHKDVNFFPKGEKKPWSTKKKLGAGALALAGTAAAAYGGKKLYDHYNKSDKDNKD